MAPSVDGRIVTRRWPVPGGIISSEYERTATSLGGDAWIIGRVSMEPYAGKGRVSVRSGRTRIRRTDFIAREDATSYAIAIDPSGKLRWKSGFIDEDHVVTVLTDRVSERYLGFLRDQGVSYLFAGRDRIDIPGLLQKLRDRLGIGRLLLEGGGKINGSFLAADCIDEVSILFAPVADGSVGTPALFDAPDGTVAARRLQLVSVERRSGDLLWVRYHVRHERP